MTKDIDLKKHIRSIPDFPKPGILFYDISTLLAHAKAWHATIERMADLLRPYKPDVLAGIESRGFLLAAPLALALGTGFVMLRKQGKLPGTTIRHTYALEYTDTIEIQNDAIRKGARVVWSTTCSTGGTLAAAATLLEQVGGVVPAAACVIELTSSRAARGSRCRWRRCSSTIAELPLPAPPPNRLRWRRRNE
jgi:adenine phosphoribosyltransferase